MNFSLRHRVLFFVGALIVLSLLGSSFSLYRVTHVDQSMDSINRVAVPLGRLLTRLRADSHILRRELEQRLSFAHWQDPHWRPRPLPHWIKEVMNESLNKTEELLSDSAPWGAEQDQRRWRVWAEQARVNYQRLMKTTDELYQLLLEGDQDEAVKLYPSWTEAINFLVQHLRNGVKNSEVWLAQGFQQSKEDVSRLRLGMQAVLVVVVVLSFMLLWLGERALRPLSELAILARKIANQGLTRQDRAKLSEFDISDDDEVGRLAREFNQMATALLEREIKVEEQRRRLEEKNRQELDLERRLRIAENLAAMGRMSAQVAHEVRNPLHSIGLEAEMALEEAQKKKNPVLAQTLSSILESVDRLESITENYLKMSKLGTGQKANHRLSEILQTVLGTYSTVCENQKVELNWKFETGAREALVHVDRDLIEQIVGNLLRNSLQALEGRSAETGKIEIRMGTLESGRSWLEIQDNGPGIGQDVRDKLFQPFVTSKADGTGLGLSFVKKVMQDHGGDIEVVYDCQLGGACFRLYFASALKERKGLNENTLSG